MSCYVDCGLVKSGSPAAAATPKELMIKESLSSLSEMVDSHVGKFLTQIKLNGLQSQPSRGAVVSERGGTGSTGTGTGTGTGISAMMVSHHDEQFGSNSVPMAPVRILTMHKAKGNEFDDVYLTGWEEGVFPQSGDVEVDEERRLAYVALTRSRQRATISYAGRRVMKGGSGSGMKVRCEMRDASERSEGAASISRAQRWGGGGGGGGLPPSTTKVIDHLENFKTKLKLQLTPSIRPR